MKGEGGWEGEWGRFGGGWVREPLVIRKGEGCDGWVRGWGLPYYRYYSTSREVVHQYSPSWRVVEGPYSTGLLLWGVGGRNGGRREEE